MKRLVFLFGLMAALALHSPQPAQAQEQVWLQIEAQPTLREAEERARAYTGAFNDVVGYQLNSGWYAIALGPYTPSQAEAKLSELKRERLVPGDSFVADGRNFKQPFWLNDASREVPPVETTTLPEVAAPEGAVPEVTEPEVAAIPETIPESVPEVPQVTETIPDPVFPEETPAEARRSEATLTRDDRMALQTALQWFGHYSANIDGAFGPGTRNSMAAWQEANALEPTGILTTLQRDTLMAAYGVAQAELGLQSVTEAESGIEITLPMALVQFDHYEPPFVHYAEKNDSGVRVILLSEPGDQSTLYGLYDVLQTLEVVPLDGPRERNERSFTLTGQSAKISSHTFAELSKGLIKGYMLIWNPKDDERMARVLATMQTTFKPVGDRALDPGLVPMPAAAMKGLLSGLEVRRPTLSRTGFYVDTTGTVLTTTEALQSCTRITLDRDTEASVIATDAALGVALLKPAKPLAPPAVAGLQTTATRAGAEIAVSGYSYEDRLSSPTLTFGSFDEDKGLNNEPNLARLTLNALPGDAGGPVLDTSGNVLGILLPRTSDNSRQLPENVSFAASAPALAAMLETAGIAAKATTHQGALAPEDLSNLALGMTVLVSCWQ